MAAVTLRNLTKLYPASRAGVRDVSLDIASGEHFVLVGPSGAGKTTLLRLIAGLETPDTGQVLIGARDVTRTPPHQRRVALVAQRPALYPHLSVRHNLAAGVEFRQGRGRWWRRLIGRAGPEVSSAELAERVAEAARVLGLTDLLDRSPRHLSGGEQQRVALGRAWVARAAVWLLDEPLAHLEITLREQIRAQLHLLRGRLGATMIEVTHDPVEALALGQRVAVLRAGAVEQVGPPADLYAQPRSRSVATALGSPPMNLADAVATRDDGRPVLRTPGGWSIPLPAGWPVDGGRAVTLGVRPERIMALNAGVPAGGPPDPVPLGDWAVTRAEPRGPAWLLTVARPGLCWRAWWPGPPAEATLPLAVPADAVYLFDAATGARIESAPVRL
jgi:ABC-type sugar transport system ATPase subunit